MNVIEVKKCSKCGEEKPYSEFSKDKKRLDGLNSWCKHCVKIYQIQYCKDNPDKIKNKRKRHYLKSSKIELKRSKEYHLNNKQSINSRQRLYSKNNPHIFGVNKNKRRALRISSLHPEHNSKIEQLFFKMAIMLKEETDKVYHVDHILPLSKGGLHHHCNLQIIEGLKNLEKANSLTYQDPWLMHFTDLPDTVLDSMEPDKLESAFKEIEGIEINSFNCFENHNLNIQNVK